MFMHYYSVNVAATWGPTLREATAKPTDRGSEGIIVGAGIQDGRGVCTKVQRVGRSEMWFRVSLSVQRAWKCPVRKTDPR